MNFLFFMRLTPLLSCGAQNNPCHRCDQWSWALHHRSCYLYGTWLWFNRVTMSGNWRNRCFGFAWRLAFLWTAFLASKYSPWSGVNICVRNTAVCLHVRSFCFLSELICLNKFSTWIALLLFASVFGVTQLNSQGRTLSSGCQDPRAAGTLRSPREFARSLARCPLNVPKAPCSEDWIELSQLYLAISLSELCGYVQCWACFLRWPPLCPQSAPPAAVRVRKEHP